MADLIDLLVEVRGRRIIYSDDVPEGWHTVINQGPIPFEKGILKWVAENTTGKFYLDPCTLAFEKSEDAFIYELGFGQPQKKL